MTAVVAFALDCAASGRWARGLLALGSALHTRDDAHTHARLALAATAAAHDSWRVALSLLRAEDVLPSQQHQPLTPPAERQRPPSTSARHVVVAAAAAATPSRHVHAVCRVLDAVSRSRALPSHAYTRCVTALLHAVVTSATSTTPTDAALQTQRMLFLAATRWASCAETRALYAALHSPCVQCTSHLRDMTALHAALRRECGVLATRHDDDDTTAATLSSRHTQTPQQQRQRHARHVTPLRGRVARERAALQRMRRHAATAAAQAQARRHVVAALQPRPSALSVAWLLRVTSLYATNAAVASASLLPSSLSPSASPHTRHALPLRVTWRAALSLVATPRLTDEVAYVYARCVGVCAPQLWATALRALEPYMQQQREQRQQQQQRASHDNVDGECTQRGASTTTLCSWPWLQLWLCSRGSWRAAAAVLYAQQQQQQQHVSSSSSSLQLSWAMAADMLARTAMPSSVHRRLFASHLPPLASQRVWPPRTRALARLLARGVPLECVQLRPLAQHYVDAGQWQQALLLYARVPTQRLQRYAVRGLLRACHHSPPRERDDDGDASAMTAEVALHLLLSLPRAHAHRTTPLAPHSACALLRAASTWQAALRVFRTCVRHGTRCTPDMLRTLLDHAHLPDDEVRRLLRSYAGVVDAHAPTRGV